jgi:hypothetical protein
MNSSKKIISKISQLRTQNMAIIYGMADSERSLLDKLPKEVKNVDDMDRVRKEFFGKMKKQRRGRKGLFGTVVAEVKRYHYKRQVDKFQYQKVGKHVTGTHGENEVIEELLKLDDSYHILCGVKFQLPNYVTYNGRKNLKSAQMDVVVVCGRGVFMIEVKNWSDKYAQTETNSLSPHEQTERAGRILWIGLQGSVKDVNVTNVLLSIKGNLEWDEDYRSVYVKSLKNINQFIQGREEIYYEDEVKKIVKELKDYVTN